jgi:DNA polymerase I-like protein with 3'-5' exonuclease and polymerase domains
VEYAHRLNCAKADEAMDKYLRDPNTDFHNMVVDMTGLIRQRAKDCNFAKSYGAGLHKFADMTGMELEEAGAVMGQYDDEMPFVKQLMTRCTKAADRRGYIVMLDGARGHFNYWEAAWLDKEERRRGWAENYPMGECSLEEAQERSRTKGHPWYGARLKRAFTHKAGNMLIQGGAARMGKMAMREMWRAGFTPLLQMHDEFPNSIGREKDGQHIAELMRSVGGHFNAKVPFRVDEEYGCNWADAKHAWAEAKAAA